MSNNLNGGKILEYFISSNATKRKHLCRVYLPKQYLQSKERLPVLYMTDAQWCFRYYAETLAWKEKEIILVGIDHGNDAKRLYDFSFLGVNRYIDFFKNELSSHVENEYSAASHRGYMGISLGGIFGAALLSTEKELHPFYRNYLLFDGTFKLLNNNIRVFKRMSSNETLPLNINLFLSSTKQGNYKHVIEFITMYEKLGIPSLNIIHQIFDVAHENIAAPSFSFFVDKIDV